MKNVSKFLRSTAVIVLSAIMSILIVPSTSLAYADTTASTHLSEQDIVKMSEAINMSTDSEVYDIGTNPYRIFDVNNADFAKLFISSSVPDYKNYSFSASNRSDLSSEYSKERAFGSGLNVNVPIYNVSANIDTNFQTNISSSLQTINDEYYEYFERYQQTRVITTDWLSRDLTPYFSSTFIADYNNINSLKSARAFLEKYGTHVFDKYYMGGSLIITNYIVSEVNIAKEYESNNKSIGLGTQIANAVSANSNGSDMQIEGNNVSNEQTKSQMKMRARGGMNFNALTVNDLFTYKQEYFTGGGSGYVYVDWIKSFDSKQNEVVIDAENPVAVWDLLDKTSYFDATKDNYLQQAFEIMCYGNYSELCNENGINSDIIGEVEYKANNSTVKFTITNQSIKLPSGVDVKFNFGNTVLNNENIKDAKIALDKNYEYATISGNTLNIASAAAGKSIAVFVKIHDENIYKLNVAVTDNQSVYANGYGTKDQPYLISTPEQWKSFMSYSQNSIKTYYQLANDIDLQGKHFEVGGSSDRASFNGELDGNGHILSNFSVVAKSEWRNIGLFGSNVGVIRNLTVENARCMNSGIISATNAEINAGILVGENQGKLENIILKNSSARITGELKNSA
ncbi:MAC/perforin domain-containing protein, partial [Eubacterium sp.]|uniref:MAC/perforin domain-containing protein n=1 Tax=Eubacterium sp. TaxID=142586 RepID=UPI002A818848